MPRVARNDEEGLVYHLIARGVNRQNIFRDEVDVFAFKKGMVRAALYDDLRIAGFVLMTNHVHLVARRGRETLGTAMHGLLGGYAQSFNRRHGRTGHLFENRFKSKVCDSGRYLVHLIRYVHANPVRAGIVAHPEDYRHSSRHWFSRPRPPRWAHVGVLEDELGGWAAVQSFFAAPDDDADLAAISAQVAPALEKSADRPRTTDAHHRLLELCEAFEARNNLPRGTLLSASMNHSVTDARRRFTAAVVHEERIRQAAVARFLGMSRSRVHRYLLEAKRS